jgi:serine/threonine-protein kinase
MRLLGEGGMGTVHLARVEGAEGFTRPVVVKRMKRDIRASDEGNRLFIREAKILSKLQHPGIVGISDFGIEDGAHIMVLEYVHGYTLSPWLDYRHRKGLKVPVDICLFVVRRILDALHYAHHFDTEEGQEIEIVHRDVSPDNVLLSNKGYVHLLDFGVASMRGPEGQGSTNSGAFRGKLCYAAPETVHGHPASPRSDLYSAAVVLLELLTGDTPFAADSIAETFVRIINDVPEAPSKRRDDVPPGLDEAIARALAKQPTERYESALAFSRELRQFQSADDEEVTQQLKAIVREDFEALPDVVGVESLKVREAALAKILSVAPEALEEPLPKHQLPTYPDFPLRPSQAAPPPVVVLPNASTERAGPAPAPTGQKQLQGLLWGLLVVGAVIAVGLGAAVALLSRGNGEQQVVVVGGDPQGAAPEKGSDPLPPTANARDVAAPTASLEVTEVSPHEPPREISQKGTSAGTADKGIKNTDAKSQLAGAVQKKSGAFQACFSSHLKEGAEAPDAVLHFSVAKAGGAPQVKVEPAALAATPLGACLKEAALTVQFPTLDDAVVFRVPVRARVTRSKGTP